MKLAERKGSGRIPLDWFGLDWIGIGMSMIICMVYDDGTHLSFLLLADSSMHCSVVEDEYIRDDDLPFYQQPTTSRSLLFCAFYARAHCSNLSDKAVPCRLYSLKMLDSSAKRERDDSEDLVE